MTICAMALPAPAARAGKLTEVPRQSHAGGAAAGDGYYCCGARLRAVATAPLRTGASSTTTGPVAGGVVKRDREGSAQAGSSRKRRANRSMKLRTLAER